MSSEKEKRDTTEMSKNSKIESFQKLKRFTSFLKKNQKNEIPSTENIKTTVEQKEQSESKSETDSQNKVIKSLLRPETEYEAKSGPTSKFEDFVDERILLSRDIFGKKEMKVKILDVSDEHPPNQWKLGDRVKVNKILVTIKHLESQQIEEGEFDIEAIEKELTEKRHYTSTNRWVPINDIKNGYVIGSRHTSLISDAIALDYIAF